MCKALVALALILQPVLAAASSTSAPTGISASGYLVPAPFSFDQSQGNTGAEAKQDHRLFNDPPLAAREYGFAILGQAVAGALGFYIGSGLETAIEGESKSHKGFLSFTGIRYDNFYGAFWGASSGGLLGSAFTTYFVGETDEENGSLFWTLAGTAATEGGALYLATLMHVSREADWKPFIPLVTLPSIGGVLGYNVSRWLGDRKREAIVGKESAVHWQSPRLGLAGGYKGKTMLAVQAVNLTF